MVGIENIAGLYVFPVFVVLLCLIDIYMSEEFDEVIKVPYKKVRRLQQYDYQAMDNSYSQLDDIYVNVSFEGDQIWNALIPSEEIEEQKLNNQEESNSFIDHTNDLEDDIQILNEPIPSEEIEEQKMHASISSIPQSNIRILYIVTELDIFYFKEPEENDLQFETPLIDFGSAFENSLCEITEIPCPFYDRGLRYIWNKETQQCTSAYLCRKVGFDSQQICEQKAPDMCTL